MLKASEEASPAFSASQCGRMTGSPGFVSGDGSERAYVTTRRSTPDGGVGLVSLSDPQPQSQVDRTPATIQARTGSDSRLEPRGEAGSPAGMGLPPREVVPCGGGRGEP